MIQLTGRGNGGSRLNEDDVGLQQAVLGVLVGLDCTVTQDVGDRDPTFDTTASDKQADGRSAARVRYT
jgi:hypothetical protein